MSVKKDLKALGKIFARLDARDDAFSQRESQARDAYMAHMETTQVWRDLHEAQRKYDLAIEGMEFRPVPVPEWPVLKAAREAYGEYGKSTPEFYFWEEQERARDKYRQAVYDVVRQSNWADEGYNW